MRTIPLTQGKVAIVDDDDFGLVSWHRWYARRHRNTWYAQRGNRKERPQSTQMHRQILGLTDSSIQVDHFDGDGLNNRRRNLRIATNAQNLANQVRRLGKSGKEKTSRYKGVTYFKKLGKWVSRIGVDGKVFYIGIFVTEEEAAMAYDLEARKRFGEFARSNF